LTDDTIVMRRQFNSAVSVGGVGKGFVRAAISPFLLKQREWLVWSLTYSSSKCDGGMNKLALRAQMGIIVNCCSRLLYIFCLDKEEKKGNSFFLGNDSVRCGMHIKKLLASLKKKDINRVFPAWFFFTTFCLRGSRIYLTIWSWRILYWWERHKGCGWNWIRLFP